MTKKAFILLGVLSVILGSITVLTAWMATDGFRQENIRVLAYTMGAIGIAQALLGVVAIISAVRAKTDLIALWK